MMSLSPWNDLLVFGAVIVVAIGMVGIRAFFQHERENAAVQGRMPLPYRKKDYLLTVAERSFYGVLMQAVAGTWQIFVKVRLADLLWIPAGTADRQAAWNRIQSKHIDFVLCTMDTLTPVLIIELDDRSHERADRVARDEMLVAILNAAGLPLLRVPVRAGYQAQALRAQILAVTAERTPARISSSK